MISTVSPNEYLLNYGGKHHILVTPNGCKKEPFTYSAFEAKAAFDVMSILCNSHVQGNQLWMIHAAYSAAFESWNLNIKMKRELEVTWMWFL